MSKKIIKVALISEHNFKRVVGEYLIAHGMDESLVELSERWSDADHAHLNLWKEFSRWDPRLIEAVERLGARSGGHIVEVDGPFMIEMSHYGGERIVYQDQLSWNDPWSDGTPSVSEEISDSEHERRVQRGEF
jgi:hypothetical protein